MADTQEIIIGANNILWYNKAKDAETGDFLNEGSATYTITNSAGTVVASGTLAYVLASNGKYRVLIPRTDTVNLIPETFYRVVLIFEQDAYYDEWDFQVRAINRTP